MKRFLGVRIYDTLSAESSVRRVHAECTPSTRRVHEFTPQQVPPLAAPPPFHHLYVGLPSITSFRHLGRGVEADYLERRVEHDPSVCLKHFADHPAERDASEDVLRPIFD
jgi:hypothetical protein